jgi:hypothetical protein
LKKLAFSVLTILLFINSSYPLAEVDKNQNQAINQFKAELENQRKKNKELEQKMIELSALNKVLPSELPTLKINEETIVKEKRLNEEKVALTEMIKKGLSSEIYNQRLAEIDKELDLIQRNPSSTDAAKLEKEASKFNIKGIIDIDITYDKSNSGVYTSDIVASNLGLAFGYEPSEKLATEISLLYEEDDTDLEVDTATISYKSKEDGMYFQLGQMYAPFGEYASEFISDPLTLSVGEMRETAIKAGYNFGHTDLSIFVFNGTSKRPTHSDHINDIGLKMAHDLDSVRLSYGVVDDLSESDGVSAALTDDDSDGTTTDDLQSKTPAYHIGLEFAKDDFSLFIETVSVFDQFNASDLAYKDQGAKVSAYHLNIKKTFSQFETPLSVLIGFDQTKEALALTLPKTRYSIQGSLDLQDLFLVSLESKIEKDYKTSECTTSTGSCGTGRSSYTQTLQVSREF